jgi:Tfp pilus assembly protein PilE
MKNKIIEKLLKHQLKTNSTSNSGFTLTEVAIIAIIIGILSAIAAPSWEALITRQRIQAVNSQVLSILKSTQELAKSKKESYTVTFDNSVDPPEYRISSDNTGSIREEGQLNVEGQVKENQIKLYVQANNNEDQNSITFDHIGVVKDPEIRYNEPTEREDGFSVTVSTPENKVIRCVRVITLLGTMNTAEGESDGIGCATD